MEGTTQKNLSTYAQEVFIAKNNPHRLAELHIELATVYSSLTDDYKDLKLKKAEFWNCKYLGDKPLSDKAVEMRWLKEEDGKKELKIMYILKGLDKLIGAIKTSSVVNALEAKQNI